MTFETSLGLYFFSCSRNNLTQIRRDNKQLKLE
jgi:hypothetical protein